MSESDRQGLKWARMTMIGVPGHSKQIYLLINLYNLLYVTVQNILFKILHFTFFFFLLGSSTFHHRYV